MKTLPTILNLLEDSTEKNLIGAIPHGFSSTRIYKIGAILVNSTVVVRFKIVTV